MFINNEQKEVLQAEDVEFANGQKSPESLLEQDISSVSDIRFREVNDFITFEKEVYIRDGSNSKNYPIFYLATAPCFLIEARLRHEVNGGSGATVDIEKLPSGTAKESGQSMLESKFSIATRQGTVQKVGATVVLSGYQLVPGDAMALKATGTLTATSNIIVGVLLGINAKNIPTGKSVTTILVGYN